MSKPSDVKTSVATVCHQDKGGNDSGARFFYVRLPDGYLLPFGYDNLAAERASVVAKAVNAIDWPAAMKTEAEHDGKDIPF
jgi:hypothetical protein